MSDFYCQLIVLVCIVNDVEMEKEKEKYNIFLFEIFSVLMIINLIP